MAIGSHTIPRFYLEQFANPSTRSGKPGNVWVYEKNKPPRPSSTKAQGYENAYFAFVRPDGTTDESFESYVAKLEDRCNDALVCAKSELYDLTSLAHRNELASYVGLLFARSTSRRKFSAENWAKLQQPYGQLEFNEEYVQDAAAHYSDTTGVTIGPEKIRELIRNQAASFATKKLTGNTFVEKRRGALEEK